MNQYVLSFKNGGMVMNQYVLDTGFFVVSRGYYEKIFPSFWEELDELIDKKILSSVDQMKEEWNNYGGEQKYLEEWIKKNTQIFTNPTSEEENMVRNILKNQDFQKLISRKQREKKNPVADPFVIAKAKINKATVVTTEQLANKDKNGKRQGNYKIPDVCAELGIECISPEKFMEQQKWKF